MRDANPFATRFTRPGAIEYIFPPSQSAASLVEKFAKQDWLGEIVGPHGSGKSTLVAALVPELERAGRKLVRRVIRNDADGQKEANGIEVVPPKYAAVMAGSKKWDDKTVLVLDGIEQLSWWWRRRVRAECRRRGAGLLVTTHEPLDLPLLFRTQPSEPLAQQIVAQLLADHPSPVTPADVTAAFKSSDGNLREMLFALYDGHQARR
jgi:energy-coupling factor transporter ATP-binding protein EcfA2